MKNFIIAFSFIFSLSVNAQKVSLGPEIGVNLIPMEDLGIGQNYQLGYYFGGNLKINLSKKFRLSTGVFISQKKKSYSSSSSSPLIDKLFGGFGGFIGVDTSGLDSLLNIPGLNTKW